MLKLLAVVIVYSSLVVVLTALTPAPAEATPVIMESEDVDSLVREYCALSVDRLVLKGVIEDDQKTAVYGRCLRAIRRTLSSTPLEFL